MARINHNYHKLAAGYLFPEIARRTKSFLETHPGVAVLKLGIGNTTEPLAPFIVEGLKNGVEKLSQRETYSGYGDEQGDRRLRTKIAGFYEKRGVELAVDEVFVSDGAKPDSGNIQSIFGTDNLVAVQDPAYPVYVDTNVIAGRSGEFDPEKQQYSGLVYMPCSEENGFFPELPQGKVDLIYLCSPNNPTGTVATKEQLEAFVNYALKHKAVIIFDAAYAEYIQDPSLPHSIYEVPGAQRCAIEINSFSKSAGFTGVRLGWSVVPEALETEDSAPGELQRLWNRRQSTFFNGASNIVQEGGLAFFEEEGQQQAKGIIDYYMENARLIKAGVEKLGLKSYGGNNAPYIWMKTPQGLSSWDFFDKLLAETHVQGTPGVGFGPAGEGFFRLSAFGHRENIEAAVASITSNLKL